MPGQPGRRPRSRRSEPQCRPPLIPGPDGVIRLSGGNPQIAKGEGEAVIQAYIHAMPGWKRAVGECIDAIITRTIPNVAKAVKWNSPLYGISGQGWFLGLHCYARYVKIAFFQGTSLKPMPPVGSRQASVRYLHVMENDPLDEHQFAEWIKQAALLPLEQL